MPTPYEFTHAGVSAIAEDFTSTYADFHQSGEPYRSLIDHNPWLRVPKARDSLEWGAGWYYDTTIGRLHPDWQGQELPTPTKAANKLQDDFVRWGYCIIEEGLSDAQCARIRDRISAQAEAERQLRIAHVSPAQQNLWSLVNKGDVFTQCMEHDPQAIQAGPLIEHLMDRWVGKGWNHLSFIANISFPDCHPQGMHQDQSFIAPYATDVPVLVNTIYILQDVDQTNGGTLIIPGSHRLQRNQSPQYGPVPKPINLEAPSGSIVLTDGRLLHGGAVNRSDDLRYIITNSIVRPWIRQQECFALTIRPEVLAQGSDKFLARCGLLATGTRNMIEGYGYAGNAKTGDPNGSMRHARALMDEGEYRWVGELNPEDCKGLTASDFSLGILQSAYETHRDERLFALFDRMSAANI